MRVFISKPPKYGSYKTEKVVDGEINKQAASVAFKAAWGILPIGHQSCTCDVSFTQSIGKISQFGANGLVEFVEGVVYTVSDCQFVSSSPMTDDEVDGEKFRNTPSRGLVQRWAERDAISQAVADDLRYKE